MPTRLPTPWSLLVTKSRIPTYLIGTITTLACLESSAPNPLCSHLRKSGAKAMEQGPFRSCVEVKGQEMANLTAKFERLALYDREASRQTDQLSSLEACKDPAWRSMHCYILYIAPPGVVCLLDICAFFPFFFYFCYFWDYHL